MKGSDTAWADVIAGTCALAFSDKGWLVSVAQPFLPLGRREMELKSVSLFLRPSPSLFSPLIAAAVG